MPIEAKKQSSEFEPLNEHTLGAQTLILLGDFDLKLPGQVLTTQRPHLESLINEHDKVETNKLQPITEKISEVSFNERSDYWEKRIKDANLDPTQVTFDSKLHTWISEVDIFLGTMDNQTKKFLDESLHITRASDLYFRYFNPNDNNPSQRYKSEVSKFIAD